MRLKKSKLWQKCNLWNQSVENYDKKSWEKVITNKYEKKSPDYDNQLWEGKLTNCQNWEKVTIMIANS